MMIMIFFLDVYGTCSKISLFIVFFCASVPFLDHCYSHQRQGTCFPLHYLLGNLYHYYSIDHTLYYPLQNLVVQSVTLPNASCVYRSFSFHSLNFFPNIFSMPVWVMSSETTVLLGQNLLFYFPQMENNQEDYGLKLNASNSSSSPTFVYIVSRHWCNICSVLWMEALIQTYTKQPVWLKDILLRVFRVRQWNKTKVCFNIMKSVTLVINSFQFMSNSGVMISNGDT